MLRKAEIQETYSTRAGFYTGFFGGGGKLEIIDYGITKTFPCPEVLCL